MLPLMLWTIPRGTLRMGVWYVVGCSCRSPPLFVSLSALSQDAGTYPECSGISIKPRKNLDGSLR